MKPFDYQQLDDIIHSRIRLAVMSLLAAVESAEFTFVRDNIGATDGNVGIHLKKLEDAGYISVNKRFVNRKPVTSYTLTSEGRRAFEIYLDSLEKMLAAKNGITGALPSTHGSASAAAPKNRTKKR
jgi:DNA-binding transcriptional ArsR family regulator